MLKNSLAIIWLLCLCFSLQAQNDESQLFFDFENCFSNSGTEGSSSDYSEFTAETTNESECATLSVFSDHIYRNNSSINTHSCTPGNNTGIAMCVSIDDNCSYDAGNDKSIRFDVLLEPSSNMTAMLNELTFYENAPENFQWINGTSGPNNYPTLYGIRVLKDGEVIYEEENVETENTWNQEIYIFSDLPAFIVSEPTLFSFELLPYCPIGNGAPVAAWDIDDLQITAGCDPVNGGIIDINDETEIEICAGDGSPNIMEVNVSNAVGQNFDWLITNPDGLILDITDSPIFDFEGAGGGTCIIWHLAYADGLAGLDIGNMTSDLLGSFDLSNPITVIRNGVNGGSLTTENGETEITICAGDNIPDPIHVNLTETEGEFFSWLITDENLNLLALPAAPPFDLDGAGAGTCLIWNISYHSGLEGLEIENNVTDLVGCYAVSNPITVYRNDPEGGTLTLTSGSMDTIVCVGDGIEDPLEVSLSGSTGNNFSWVITDENATILALPDAPPFDLEGAGPGTCLIWNVSYEEGLQGLEVGMNATQLSGCFELSNAISVERSFNEGGTIMFSDSTEIQTICAGDGISDPLDVQLEGAQGPNMGWIISDFAGNILALPAAPPFDLEDAGEGTCLIWHVAFAENVAITTGVNIADIEGCYDVSNSLIVERISADGGILSFDDGSTEQVLCVGDGNEDNLSIELNEESGEFFQWVVTNELDEIIAISAAPDFNFEEDSSGICQIWHLAYTGTIVGAEIGMGLDDLSGCFGLSNPLTLIKEQVSGGTLATSDGETQLTICADDGESDAFEAILINSVGENNQWIVTDANGIILDLPDAPLFDFEGAGLGACLIWNMAYNGVINGLEIEANVENIEGCYALSNPITVTRLVGDACDIFLCEAEGGSIMFTDSTTSVTICTGDGIADSLEVLLSGQIGSISSWVITDVDANILALPSAPPFNLEGVEPGICLIWHLSYEDGLMGLEVGNNATQLDGCFDLSNPLTVTRVSDEECEELNCMVNGGDITFEDGSLEVEICAGDSIPDILDVILENEVGEQFSWIITNISGEILDLPETPPFDFENAGPGICLIWHIAYQDNLGGLEIGQLTDSLAGCFDLSNPLLVTRLTGEACNSVDCTVEGGSISLENGEESIEICLNDSIPDVLNIMLENEIGDSSIWIITDGNGLILALQDTNSIDFGQAPPGVCLIWHMSYTDEIDNLSLGSSISMLAGCFDLSNQISVLRYADDDCLLIDCDADGGSISLADSTLITTICTDDGIDDLIELNISGNIGEVSAWIITDANGIIIGIPATPPPFNLEGFEEGICNIWNISYNGNAVGIDINQSIDSIVGCYDLSNAVTVVKLTGTNCDQIGCDADGGDLVFPGGNTEETICLDDSSSTVIDVVITNVIGDSTQWIITDETGIILALPDSFPYDFQSSEPGLCLIWHAAFIGDVSGIGVGGNANTLEGCINLSNPVALIKEEGEDCTNGLDEDEISFQLYPNPATDEVFVSLNQLPEEIGTAEIFTVNGESIINAQGKEGDVLRMNISNQPDGVYFVRTVSGNKSIVKRLIKIR